MFLNDTGLIYSGTTSHAGWRAPLSSVSIPVSDCQPSLLLSWCHLLHVLPDSSQPGASRGRSPGGSLGIECESGVNDRSSAPLLAPGTIISRLQKSLSVLGRGRACHPASDPGLTCPAWVTLNAAQAISRGLGLPICRMGEVGGSPPGSEDHTRARGCYVVTLCTALTTRGGLGLGWRLGSGEGRGWGGEVRNNFKLLRNRSLD